MRKCPKCGSYLYFSMRYVCGLPIITYFCTCGYSSENEAYATDNKTHIDKDCKFISTDHT